MDPSVLALATVAANVLVSAMSTDAWQQVRAAMVALWQRALPEQADAIATELAEVRAQVLASRDSGDELVEAAVAAEWQRRIQRLLEAEPALVDELRQALDVLAALDERPQNDMRATASDHGRIYQAGRDLHISVHERDGSAVGNTPPGPPLGDDDDEW
ncbi:hypothetical protein [Streptomyces viridochromogenes]|uniref:hypothetical protein n=1 Tax=Streptomyces viridochromogenes TaxID=1938 RepID=UPI00065CA59D|nr:hypothetical protein [Streptomyces viridochromogenes]